MVILPLLRTTPEIISGELNLLLGVRIPPDPDRYLILQSYLADISERIIGAKGASN